MHELALCGSIRSIVQRAAAGQAVAVVEVDVGALRQVVPETLVHCWAIVNQGTELADARLEIRELPAVLICQACGFETRLGELAILACTSCGATNVEIVSGEEFIVRSLVLKGSDGQIPPP